ncbi:unnamed protein product [Meloidogyne enterolobii]|uniref:Uncharacterized protein n=1 Tax=Meloidogyne enterolobii TaxID=390850 RepID=A0ACB0ZGB6_MELEN
MSRKTSLASEVKEQNINEETNVKPIVTTDTQNTSNDVIEIHTPFYEPLTKEELAKVNVEHKKDPKKEYLWKLIRCKYMLTIKLCDECQNRLFSMQDKFVRYASGVTLKIDLCNKCIDTNCRASDVLAPFREAGSKRKAN